MAFLLGALYFKNRFLKFSVCIVSLLLHDSNWFFIPLVLLLSYNSRAFSKRAALYWSIPMVAGVGYLFVLSILSRFGEASRILGFYENSYAEANSIPFLLYIISPLFLVFAVPRLCGEANPSREERIVFWYSVIILAVSISIFPAITYRFSMTVITLMVFVAMRSSRISVRSGAFIAYGLTAHFMIYAFWAKNVMAVFHG